MMLRRCYTALLMAALALSAGAAPSFHASVLKELAHLTGLILPDVLDANIDNDSTWNYHGRALRIRTNAYGDVSHIGYKLFDSSWADTYTARPLLDFLERFALEEDVLPDSKKTESVSRKSITFINGNATLLKTLTPSTSFRIDEQERRNFLVEWGTGKNKVSLMVDADCQTLLGVNLLELEEMLERNLSRTSSELPDNCLPESWRDCDVSISDDLAVADAGIFLSDLIRARLYLRPDEAAEGNYHLLMDDAYPWQSLNNLLLTGYANQTVPMQLTLDKYGNNKKDLTLTLQQFVRYCILEGCKLYLGVKERSKDELSATLFAVNTKLAYCHTVSLRVPLEVLHGNGAVKGTLYAFTPLQNITEKFFITNP